MGDGDSGIVDLTEDGDLPPSMPAQAPATRRRRQRSEVDDSDFEIIRTVTNMNPLVQTSAASNSPQSSARSALSADAARGPRSGISNSHKRARRSSPLTSETSTNDDEIEVIGEVALTAQDRLRQIQERHARGEVVDTSNRSRPRLPRPRSMFAASMFGIPFNNDSDDEDYEDDSYVATRPRGGGLGSGLLDFASRMIGPLYNQPSESLEHSLMQRVLHTSMSQYSNHKPVDPATVKKPPEPQPAGEGFTRGLGDSSTQLVCVKCNHELGETLSEGNTEFARNMSSRVFVRGCGHTYCGLCVHDMKETKSSRDRKCPVEGCKLTNAKKRRIMREVFL